MANKSAGAVIVLGAASDRTAGLAGTLHRHAELVVVERFQRGHGLPPSGEGTEPECAVLDQLWQLSKT
ncbi:hypothetical protein SAMN05421881_10379 [Nitrosomonas halophila]|uniref:Uncharacterized protein n=1 Tax=Nitrosomonas halophila TaxID=44576 RepID=A0A1H3K3B9_9PROT|nr:hypothetical protein SAMN05421881_10379 [Nitrosomonas halophila]